MASVAFDSLIVFAVNYEQVCTEHQCASSSLHQRLSMEHRDGGQAICASIRFGVSRARIVSVPKRRAARAAARPADAGPAPAPPLPLPPPFLPIWRNLALRLETCHRLKCHLKARTHKSRSASDDTRKSSVFRGPPECKSEKQHDENPGSRRNSRDTSGGASVDTPRNSDRSKYLFTCPSRHDPFAQCTVPSSKSTHMKRGDWYLASDACFFFRQIPLDSSIAKCVESSLPAGGIGTSPESVGIVSVGRGVGAAAAREAPAAAAVLWACCLSSAWGASLRYIGGAGKQSGSIISKAV
jgi:hypothetical protein